MGAESLSRRRIAVIASGREYKHVSLRELNPVKVRPRAISDFKQHAFIDQCTRMGSRRGAGERSAQKTAARLQQSALPPTGDIMARLEFVSLGQKWK